MQMKPGLYVGTLLDDKWWKPYFKDGLLFSGNIDYWFDDEGIYFKLYIKSKSIFIPFSSILVIKKCKFHGINYINGYDIIKLVWNNNGKILSTGLVFSKYSEESAMVLNKIKHEVEKIKTPT